MTATIDELHEWPEGTVRGFDQGAAGGDQTVHIRFSHGEILWHWWVDHRGRWHRWTPRAQARRACKRFIREEIARRRLERRRR